MYDRTQGVIRCQAPRRPGKPSAEEPEAEGLHNGSCSPFDLVLVQVMTCMIGDHCPVRREPQFDRDDKLGISELLSG
ncbi:hypothetical protein RRG08_051309 [Elysia crispata]|uniref:Uncharacterized protein n=1 Tax=Elysia crispata TaxID=231223 RepID=A0AAE1DHX7_9GAST|nr:hypothetical protein RRG08_051309 [Elysia crispata]